MFIVIFYDAIFILRVVLFLVVGLVVVIVAYRYGSGRSGQRILEQYGK